MNYLLHTKQSFDFKKYQKVGVASYPPWHDHWIFDYLMHTSDFDVLVYASEKQWLDNQGIHHRVGRPAIIIDRPDRLVYKAYYIHGARHRENGPAIKTYFYDPVTRRLFPNNEYWLHGKQVKKWQVKHPHRSPQPKVKRRHWFFEN